MGAGEAMAFTLSFPKLNVQFSFVPTSTEFPIFFQKLNIVSFQKEKKVQQDKKISITFKKKLVSVTPTRSPR